jgi:hypothetical protein
MKKAMVTIEVLVSMLILFLVISTSFEGIKFFNIINNKKSNYEDEYIAVLNIKDKISANICKTSSSMQGTINDFNYKASCENLKELRTFKKAFDLDDPSGNIGNYIVKLYRVNISLKKDNYEKNYNYLIEQSEKTI